MQKLKAGVVNFLKNLVNKNKEKQISDGQDR